MHKMAAPVGRRRPFKPSGGGVAPAARGRGVSREGRSDVGGARRGALRSAASGRRHKRKWRRRPSEWGGAGARGAARR